MASNRGACSQTLSIKTLRFFVKFLALLFAQVIVYIYRQKDIKLRYRYVLNIQIETGNKNLKRRMPEYGQIKIISHLYNMFGQSKCFMFQSFCLIISISLIDPQINRSLAKAFYNPQFTMRLSQFVTGDYTVRSYLSLTICV